MPRVKLRYFAVLRERAGRDEEERDLPEGSTPSSAFELLFPALRGLRCLYAVDRSYVAADHPLADGDELAFIPPLGGG